MSDNNEIGQTEKTKICHFCGLEGKMNILWMHKINDSYLVDENEYLEEDIWYWHEKRFEIHECKSCSEIHLYKEVWDENCSGPRVKNGHLIIDEYGYPLEDYFPNSAKIVYPVKALELPSPHPLMPDNVRNLYEEARQVFPISRRSSAALLRLVIQELCIVLGGDGKNLNKDIKKILNQMPDHIQQALDIEGDGKNLNEDIKKFLNQIPDHTQQALDIIRIVGNSAVHLGEISIHDDNDIVEIMFDLVNEIVDEKIAKPKKKSEVRRQYEKLPDSKKREFKTS